MSPDGSRGPVDGPSVRSKAAPSLERVPALDGLRGLAVAAVLLFHGGFAWASGGYLGVSVFFTLSGFLITRLLTDEHRRTGRIDFVSFSARRLRRLLPASVLCLTAILVLTQLGAFADVVDLRRDLLGAVSQIGANWAQLTSGRGYAAIFENGASPVEHYWSLAIEEQFYLLWPPVFALVWARRNDRRQAQLAVGSWLVLAAVPWVIAARWGPEATYLSTPARLSEIFAGVALAMVLKDRAVPVVLRWLAVVALLVVAGLVVATPAGRGWAYAGGLPLFAVLSAVLIAGLQVDGPAQRLLACRPLVGLGTISYGLYLFHWPIFILADQHPAGLSGPTLFVAKCVASLLAAVVSYVFLERPVRRGRVATRVTVGTSVVAVAAILVATVVVAPGPDPGFGDVARSKVDTVRIDPEADGADWAPGDRPVRILVVGDSTGEVMGGGLIEWAYANPGTAQIDNRSLGGCGFVRGGRFGNFIDRVREECDQLIHEELPRLYGELRPDIVLISIAAADTWDRSWDDGPVQRATDPDYRARIERDYAEVFEAAVEAGVPRVVWLRPAQIGTEPKYADPSYLDGSQVLVQETVEAAVRKYPGRVEILDFRTWFEGTEYPHDLKVRPDGVHLIPEVATTVATDWLGPELLALAR